MWPDCLRFGVAAITYGWLEKTDLSKFPEGEPKELWAKLYPAQKASLRRVAYAMKARDVIYVKRGPEIVGKGVVQGGLNRAYKFDSSGRLTNPDGFPWPHQVPVKWASDFSPVRILLGAEQFTVKELSAGELKQLEKAIDDGEKADKEMDALEGEAYLAEAMFRSRNRSLIQAKKSNSDYRCEVCGFKFEEKYGLIGREYIVAHHVRMIARGPSKTTLDGIALVCANCHAMIHTKNPAVSIDELRKLVAHTI